MTPCQLPRRIYMQIFGDGDPAEPGEISWPEVSWCLDQIFDQDLEYVISPRSLKKMKKLGYKIVEPGNV